MMPSFPNSSNNDNDFYDDGSQQQQQQQQYHHQQQQQPRIEVRDFDVLADELPGVCYDMDDYEKQIGNNRFEVLIQMYQEEYNLNDANNNMEECHKIIQKIVDVTCHKPSVSSHNQGRFLVKSISDRHWRQLNDEQSKEFIKQQLRATTFDETQEDPDPFANHHTYGVDNDDDDDIFGGINGRRIHPTSSIDEEDILEPLPVTSQIDLDNSEIPSLDFGSMGLNDKKRGRRSSLLRRSVSESTLMDDKKKTFKNLVGELSLLRGDDNNSPTMNASGSALDYFNSMSSDLPELPAAAAPGRLHRSTTVSNSDPSAHPSSASGYRRRVYARSPTRSSSDAGPVTISSSHHHNPMHLNNYYYDTNTIHIQWDDRTDVCWNGCCFIIGL